MSTKYLCFKDINLLSKKLNTNKYAVILPTDTVIGIISHNKELIYKIKNRPLNKKLVSFVPSLDFVNDLSQKEKNVIKKYLPGSLTIVKNKLAYRIPNHKNLLKLLKLTGPIYSSSANISGQNPINDTTQAVDVFKKHLDKLLIVKGKILNGTPSTIVDLDLKKVLRNGKINGNTIIKEINS